MPQGNSLCSYLKQAKMSLFSFSFFLIQNQRTEEQNRSCLGAGIGGKGEEVGKGYRRVNMVQILCVHVCKWKK
jgi:hypothetical protein